MAPIVFWNECEYVIVCVDRTSNDGHSTGYGDMDRRFSRESKSRTGLQVGYDKLGSIEGSESYDVYSGGFILPNMRRLTATWKHDASIIHAELIGGGSFSEERDSGAVFLVRKSDSTAQAPRRWEVWDMARVEELTNVKSRPLGF